MNDKVFVWDVKNQIQQQKYYAITLFGFCDVLMIKNDFGDRKRSFDMNKCNGHKATGKHVRYVYHDALVQLKPLLWSTEIYRVGSHVVSVRIHCTEKWRTSFHTDVLSKSK